MIELMFQQMFQKIKRNRPPESKGSSLVKPGLVFELLEDRSLLAGMPLGALPTDTGEFLLGTVAVTPVLFESNGQIDLQSQNWTAEEIDEVLTKVSEGVNWWSDLLDTLGTVHQLEFVIDDTFALTPYSTPYEPIDRPSNDFTFYAGGFLLDQGQSGAGTIEDAVYGFNQSQREKLGTDWAFTIFIADSSDDADGLFDSGGNFSAAFAYAGGLFVVTPSTRPASTIAHEMGHIFWARDEYPGASSWTDLRGYYNTQNTNAADNPNAAQEISIMRGGVPLSEAYQSYVSPDSTLAMVGWQDSDQDGIFDVADVPLSLQASGFFDASTLTYHLTGEASAVPLANKNSSGNQSDITLNRVSEVQYRLDGGAWITADSPNLQKVSLDLSVVINSPFAEIEWRAIDTSNGVKSPSYVGTTLTPAVPLTGLTGLVYLDENENDIQDVSDPRLVNTQVHLSRSDGSPLYYGNLIASDLPDGPIGAGSGNLEISALSAINPSQVSVGNSNVIPNTKVFQYFDSQRGWIERWNSSNVLNVSLLENIGELSVQLFGNQDSSYARLEAYNANGELVHRVTSNELVNNEGVELRITRAAGDIRSVRIYGYAGSSVSVASIEYGFDPIVLTDATGSWRVPFLSEGLYRITYEAEQVIHGFSPGFEELTVNHSEYQVHLARARRVNSQQHNTTVAEDVNEDHLVTASDALTVINDLNRFSPRILMRNDPTTFKVDVNNDGAVSALDALIVINSLSRISTPSGEAVFDQDNFLRRSAFFTSYDQNLSPSRSENGSVGGCVVGVSMDYEDFNRPSESVVGTLADTKLVRSAESVLVIDEESPVTHSTTDKSLQKRELVPWIWHLRHFFNEDA